MARTVANSIPAKAQKRENYEDWISQLPDEILITILYRLCFLEAASTCVLSKRWKYLWTHVKVLNFEFPKKLIAVKKDRKSLLVERPKYVGWVNRVLQLHQGPHITDFKVNFFLNCKNSRDIDEWFNFAIVKSVQRLELNLLGSSILGTSGNRCYTPPDKIYSLIKSPFGLSCIKSLTQLTLKSVNVTGELVEHFLSNCPLLQRLCVSFSGLLVNLNVTGPSLCLKFLEISSCHCLQTVDISAPNLASFICPGEGKATQVLVRHAPSLADVAVAYRNAFSNAPLAISSYFSQLESLTLSINLHLGLRLPPPLPELTNLKNLTLRVYANKQRSYLHWTSLIERSPFLHKFTLQLISLERIQKKIWRPTRCRLHKCLKVVEFVGNIDFEFAMYFVQNAVALQKIIVDCRPFFFQAWDEFIENERSTEMRKHALELKKELPCGVQLVMRPVAQGLQDPSSAVLAP